MDSQQQKEETFLQALRSAESNTEANHWIRISESESAFLATNYPDWEAGSDRIQDLSDEQVIDAYRASCLQLGDHESQFNDALFWRQDLFNRMVDLTEWLSREYWNGGAPDYENDSREKVDFSLQAKPFEWAAEHEELHQMLLPLALAGVFQAIGYKIVGTNIPNYDAGPEQEFFWPERGLLPLKWTPEDAIVYAAEQMSDTNSQ